MSKKRQGLLNYTASIKFKEINREVNISKPIKYYKEKFCDKIIGIGMQDIFYLLDTRNQEKKWELLLNQYQFSMDYAKQNVKRLKQVYNAYQYVIQNLT